MGAYMKSATANDSRSMERTPRKRKFQELDFLVTQLGRPLEGNDPAGGTEILEQMKTWYGRHQIVQSHQALA